VGGREGEDAIGFVMSEPECKKTGESWPGIGGDRAGQGSALLFCSAGWWILEWLCVWGNLELSLRSGSGSETFESEPKVRV
jgi:hypothetical protein